MILEGTIKNQGRGVSFPLYPKEGGMNTVVKKRSGI